MGHCLSISWELATVWRHVTSLIVSVGSGNGLVPPGNRPLTEPMLTKFYDIILSVVNELIRCEQMTQYITGGDFFFGKKKSNIVWQD